LGIEDRINLDVSSDVSLNQSPENTPPSFEGKSLKLPGYRLRSFT
jgi:hypothetical protein